MDDFAATLVEKAYLLPAIVLGFTVHELCHAAIAVALGDDTPKRLGRLTLNPLRHVDPFGLIMVLVFGFGWARPVMYNPANLKRRAEYSVLIALAGPFSNLLLSFLCLLGMKALSSGPEWARTLVLNGAAVNASLFVFNLIPIPPLDGSHLLFWAIPDRFQRFREAFLKYGQFLLLILILASSMADVDPLMIGTMSGSLLRGMARLIGLA